MTAQRTRGKRTFAFAVILSKANDDDDPGQPNAVPAFRRTEPQETRHEIICAPFMLEEHGWAFARKREPEKAVGLAH